MNPDGSNESVGAAIGVAFAVGVAFAIGVGTGASGDVTVGVETVFVTARTVAVAIPAIGAGFTAGTGALSGAGGGGLPSVVPSGTTSMPDWAS